MLYLEKSSLLESDCTVIAHQMNAFRNMESELAAIIRSKYPNVYEADKNYRLPPRERMGSFSFALIEEEPRLVFNLYGQFRHNDANEMNDYTALLEAMGKMFQAVELAESKGFKIKLGMPLGIGTNGVSIGEPTILKLIEGLAYEYERTVFLYTEI